MADIRKNIAANLVGKVWVAASGLIFLPLYAQILGMESFALVGFFASLSAVLGVLDLGLVATVDREIARLSADPSPVGALAIRDLVRTFEGLFWGVGLAAAMLVIAGAPFIASDWLNSRELPVETIIRVVRVMGLIVALQWPFGIYAGGLVGLQYQVQSNALQIGATSVKTFGSLVLLLWVYPTIEAYFAWQLFTTALHTFIARVMLMRALPAHEQGGTFRRDIIVRNWRFSVGMSGISLVGVALTQVDRVLLSRILALADFGYYALASTVGRSLMYLVGPVFVAIYPRLCQLVATKDDAGTRALYHLGCQAMTCVVVPATLVLSLFSRELLVAWTANPQIVENAWTVVIAIAVGTGLNGLVNIPYALQLADGWTSLPFWANFASLLLLVPATVVGAIHYGALGAAVGWPFVSFIYVVGMVIAMHRRLLPTELATWCRDDVLMPLGAAACVALPIRLLWPAELGRTLTFLLLAATGAALMGAAALGAPLLRARIFQMLRNSATRQTP